MKTLTAYDLRHISKTACVLLCDGPVPAECPEDWDTLAPSVVSAYRLGGNSVATITPGGYTDGSDMCVTAAGQSNYLLRPKYYPEKRLLAQLTDIKFESDMHKNNASGNAILGAQLLCRYFGTNTSDTPSNTSFLASCAYPGPEGYLEYDLGAKSHVTYMTWEHIHSEATVKRTSTSSLYLSYQKDDGTWSDKSDIIVTNSRTLVGKTFRKFRLIPVSQFDPEAYNLRYTPIKIEGEPVEPTVFETRTITHAYILYSSQNFEPYADSPIIFPVEIGTNSDLNADVHLVSMDVAPGQVPNLSINPLRGN